VLRWFLDGTRMSQLARDNGISKSTGYDYLREGVDVLAARAPGLHGALLAAKAAGYSHVNTSRPHTTTVSSTCFGAPTLRPATGTGERCGPVPSHNEVQRTCPVDHTPATCGIVVGRGLLGRENRDLTCGQVQYPRPCW